MVNRSKKGAIGHSANQRTVRHPVAKRRKQSARESARESARDGASSLDKMLGILNLFTAQTPIWSTNDLIRALETSRSTAYRYIKALNSVGLISAVGNGYYVLGPRIVELDLQIRECDPLHLASRGVLEQLVEATNLSALLCMLFRNSVLCIREQRAPLSPENLFSRGQRRSMFRGAMSKVILAYLPNHRLRSIYMRNRDTLRDANLGQSWDEFRNKLAEIRREGYVISHGEFHPGIAGIAAPVVNSEQMILGSVGVACQEADLGDVDVAKSVLATKRAAREISLRLASTKKGMDLPPRAVG